MAVTVCHAAYEARHSTVCQAQGLPCHGLQGDVSSPDAAPAEEAPLYVSKIRLSPLSAGEAI